MDQRIARWEALFDRMHDLVISIYGDDSIGIDEDQVWIIDDDYGGYEHKIELPSNERKHEIIDGLQRILKDGFKDWTVVVVSSGVRPGLELDPEGVRVSWNSVTR
jgi:hypothetical protein